MAFRIPHQLLTVFIDEGLVPKDCASISLVIPADGAVRFSFEVFATRKHIGKLARAFAALDKGLQVENNGGIVSPHSH
jgi:hypothetical protein